MRALLAIPVLSLALASCNQMSLVPGRRPIASVTGEQAKTSTAAVAARAHPDQDPTATQPAPPGSEVAPGVFVKGLTPVNSGSRFEEVEFEVDIRVHGSQSKLVPYLMNLDEWMITKCIHLSPMVKLYRFRRIIPAGTREPEIDPFNRALTEPTPEVKLGTPHTPQN